MTTKVELNRVEEKMDAAHSYIRRVLGRLDEQLIAVEKTVSKLAPTISNLEIQMEKLHIQSAKNREWERLERHERSLRRLSERLEKMSVGRDIRWEVSKDETYVAGRTKNFNAVAFKVEDYKYDVKVFCQNTGKQRNCLNSYHGDFSAKDIKEMLWDELAKAERGEDIYGQ